MMTQIPILVCLLLTLAGCAGRSSRPPTPPPILPACPMQVEPVPGVPVSFLVITDSQGSGNPLWTPEYLEQILVSASLLVTRSGFFQLDRRVEHASDILFALEQAALAGGICPGVPDEQFTIVISQPNTTVSAGETPVSSGAGSPSCFVMRSRHTTATPEAIDATARILVHELGHVVGYSHEPVGPDGLHADNWWTFPEGQERLTQFQTKITRRCGRS